MTAQRRRLQQAQERLDHLERDLADMLNGASLDGDLELSPELAEHFASSIGAVIRALDTVRAELEGPPAKALLSDSG